MKEECFCSNSVKELPELKINPNRNASITSCVCLSSHQRCAGLPWASSTCSEPLCSTFFWFLKVTYAGRIEVFFQNFRNIVIIISSFHHALSRKISFSLGKSHKVSRLFHLHHDEFPGPVPSLVSAVCMPSNVY